jgi:hypothetical protein
MQYKQKIIQTDRCGTKYPYGEGRRVGGLKSD